MAFSDKPINSLPKNTLFQRFWKIGVCPLGKLLSASFIHANKVNGKKRRNRKTSQMEK